ncbi:HNH endonuclease signature motif containing protein [Corynebacterium timonense]|uniref:HNH endonuclease n=1 Tax=Corynebacterium timonense TaxID=441500 RepID=A0A1H1RGX3_9CORY|nr:HNH endonuclease signature motif containing protein [Corynebacterium timonense]SDS34940.1 HNH endonuclease [Corynebacterium timonense]
MTHLDDSNEHELVDLARTLTYSDLQLALLAHRNGAPQPAARSYVRVAPRPNGRLSLWANFSPAEAARLMAALKTGELAWRSVDWSTLTGADGVLDPQRLAAAPSMYGQPTADALLSAFMGMINITLSQPNNPLRAPGAHVNIVMTTDGRAYLPLNPGAGSDAVKSFLANAHYRINRVDGTGLVLNTGRAFRLATNAQINALMLMWRSQCAMPGCTHTRFMEMHHIHDWADGGTTDLDNLLPLCSACHSLVSDGAVTILRDEGDIHFCYPDGSRYVSRDRGLPVRNDDARTLAEFNEFTWSAPS